MRRSRREATWFAAQNFRGAQLSEGDNVGYRALGWGEQKDGYDSVLWLAKQGTKFPCRHSAAEPHRSIHDGHRAEFFFHLGCRRGGATRIMKFEEARRPEAAVNLLREMFRHPVYDEYWQLEDTTRLDKMKVPSFIPGSWYAYMNVGSIGSFIGRQHRGRPQARGRQQLVIGPWVHVVCTDNSSEVGELIYPANQPFTVREHMIRWFDRHRIRITVASTCSPFTG